MDFSSETQSGRQLVIDIFDEVCGVALNVGSFDTALCELGIDDVLRLVLELEIRSRVPDFAFPEQAACEWLTPNDICYYVERYLV